MRRIEAVREEGMAGGPADQGATPKRCLVLWRRTGKPEAAAGERKAAPGRNSARRSDYPARDGSAGGSEGFGDLGGGVGGAGRLVARGGRTRTQRTPSSAKMVSIS